MKPFLSEALVGRTRTCLYHGIEKLDSFAMYEAVAMLFSIP